MLVHGDEPCADCSVADPQVRGDLSPGVAFSLQFQNLFAVDRTLWATKLLSIRSCIPNPGTHPLPNQVSLKLRDRRHDCKKRLPQRTTGVHILLVADELDAERPN